MAELTEAGCIGYAQADVPVADQLVLLRALQYAATFGYTVWLRPLDAWLAGRGGHRRAGHTPGPERRRRPLDVPQRDAQLIGALRRRRQGEDPVLGQARLHQRRGDGLRRAQPLAVGPVGVRSERGHGDGAHQAVALHLLDQIGQAALALGRLHPRVGQRLAQLNLPALELHATTTSAMAIETVEAQQFAQGRSGFIETLFGAQVAGQAALMSISDLQLRDDFRYQRLMVILIEVPKGSAPQVLQNAVDFQAKLASLGRPSCLMQAGETMWVQKTAAAAQLQPIKVANGTRSGSYIATDAPIEFGYGLAFSSEPSARFGLDGFAVLQVPTTPLPRPDPSLDAASQLAGVADLAVTIAPDQLDFAATRAETLSTLLALGDDGVTVFVDLYDFAERLYPSGFIEKRHQLTIAAQVNAPFQTPPRRDEAERARLLTDAQRAWTYFDKYTNSATGLCPSTVDIRQYGDILQAVTMWDVGSNINALVAATEMGIITEKQLFSAIKRILPNIKGRTTKGVTLPPGWLKTDRIRSGDRNFDGCDTGRLLSALHNLRLRYGMTKELEAVVAGWDLQKIIFNREIHSVVEGQLESTFASHCGHYAAVAFRHWGFDVASPYETFTTPSPADGEMRLLEAVSGIGSFGAEPLLLEAMELGMSREGAFLAEVLSTAQKEEFDSTGRLICVSETPIDTAPWFIYEGLQVGSALRAWRLNGDDKTKTQPVAPVGQDEMVFVTKAAFLWAAYKPCGHSSKLLAYARAHAAGEIGFASNVNQVTQAANLDYTDINTNAVILQSIAHMLRVS